MTSTEPYIIDTDTHFIETGDLWEGSIPAKWADQTLKVRWNDRLQREVWMLGDEVICGAWAFCQYGFSDTHTWGESPATIDEAHPATVVQSERVSLMNQYHVKAQVLYPNLAGLRLEKFLGMESKEVSCLHISIYNDYQLEYALRYPGRFIPMLVVPFWDIPQAVAEIERMKHKGFGGVVTTAAPQNHGQPYLADPHWNPLWEATVDAGMSVSFHIGNGGTGESMSADRAVFDFSGAAMMRAGMQFLDNGKQVNDLISSGILYRYPDLKFVSVESGIGWVPHVLESLDYHYKRGTRSLDSRPFGDMLPSDLFRRQVYVNFWFEELQPWHCDAIGVDNILYETDFPHPTCLEPVHVEAQLADGFKGLSDEVRDKILWGNAMNLYGRALEELADQGTA